MRPLVQIVTEKKNKKAKYILPLLPSDRCLGLGLDSSWLRGLSLESSSWGAVRDSQGGSGGILSTTEAFPLWSGEQDLKKKINCTFLSVLGEEDKVIRLVFKCCSRRNVTKREMCNFCDPDLITFWLSLSSTEFDKSSPFSGAGDFLVFKWSISTGLPSNSVSSEPLEKSIGASVSSSNIPNDTKTEYCLSFLVFTSSRVESGESEVWGVHWPSSNYQLTDEKCSPGGRLRRTQPGVNILVGRDQAGVTSEGDYCQYANYSKLTGVRTSQHPPGHYSKPRWSWPPARGSRQDFSSHCHHSLAGNRNDMNGYLLLMQFEKLDMSSFIFFSSGVATPTKINASFK